MHIQLAAIQEEINLWITTASQMGANQHNFLLLKFLLCISKTLARTKNHFRTLFPTSRLTRTMTINQAITRCKCNALNIFQTFTLHIFLQENGGVMVAAKPFWRIAVYLKIKFTPNLRRQLAAFSSSTPPELFSWGNFMNWITVRVLATFTKSQAMFCPLASDVA